MTEQEMMQRISPWEWMKATQRSLIYGCYDSAMPEDRKRVYAIASSEVTDMLERHYQSHREA